VAAALALIAVLGAMTHAWGQPAGEQEAMAQARRAYDLARAGRLDEAVEALQVAVRLAPGNPLYRSALGGVYEKRGHLEQARGALAEALRLDPGNPQFAERLEAVSLEWGAQLARERRFRAGLALARDTAARFPQSARAHLMLGLFCARNQQNVAAAAAYRRALDLDPESADASVGLGIAQSAAGMAREAAETFEAGLKKFPQDPMHRQAYGVHLVKMAEAGSAAARARAVEMLEEALAMDPGLAEAHYQLGNLALAASDAAAAEARFALAARNGLDDARLHWAWSRALRRLGREAEAARHIELFRARKAAEQ